MKNTVNIVKYWMFIFALLLTGCDSYTEKDIEGLWQLEVVEIDAMKRPVGPTFLEIKANQSFAVSRVTGDLAGVYRLRSDNLSLYSHDRQWFNTTWSLYCYRDILDLNGRDQHNRYAKLRFRKITKIPDFQEFEDKLVGNWQLYKIKKDGEIERQSATWFRIDARGNYSIADGENIIENGLAIINPRHRKLFFENDGTEWSAWFYGEELRLTDDKREVEYSLRKRQQ